MILKVLTKIQLAFIVSLITTNVFGQGPFAPPAGQSGSTAIHKDSRLFVGWAVGCEEVVRGYKDISEPDLGYASVGSCMDVIGKAGERGVLSIGDGGHVVLSFDPPIQNKPGWDFAVFENSFGDEFLELAFVEVSSDGFNFVRFPSVSLTDTLEQTGTFDTLDATNIYNLAGKYRLFYGTPFDLEELKDESGIDISNITHVKIIDVVGSLKDEYASLDSEGNKINDPWPTPFISGGFDLDAVGVINSNNIGNMRFELSVVPNPAGVSSHMRIFAPTSSDIAFEIYNLQGNLVYESEHELSYPGVHFFDFDKSKLSGGMYIIIMRHIHGVERFKMIYLEN